MSRLDPAAYGPVIGALLSERMLNPLDAGTPRSAWRERLRALDDHALFDGLPVRDRNMAEACRTGLWLAFDFLDESHALSQELHTAEGSYWHGLMHRREPDFANSKYWFRRVGTHPVFAALRAEAAQLAAGEPPQAAFLATQAAWDPFAFVDLCEQALRQQGTLAEVCRKVQEAEWELLFDHCYRRALATA
jgi:hypothetical protein